MAPLHLRPILFLLSFLLFQTLSQAAVRTIPATDDNQDYFATTQALFAYGSFKQSSCGPQSRDIEACIKTCNSPGTQERSGCCCTAFPTREFFVGIRGGCRYRQQLLNFTTRLTYVSRPVRVGVPRYFDPISCNAVDSSNTTDPCTCNKIWEISVADLAVASPLASPTPSLTPGLSPSVTPTIPPSPIPPSPSPSEAPVETPVVSIPGETPVEPTPPVESETPVPSIVLPPMPTDTPPTITPTVDPSRKPRRSRKPTPDPFVSPMEPSPGDDDDDMDKGPTPTAEVPSPETDPATSPNVTGTTPSPSPDDDGTVCVEETHLIKAGVPREHMVHAVGVKQIMLCPPGSLPCGTPKHMLRRNSVSLSYAQFCDKHVQCVRRVGVVNSVYTHLWEETTHEGGVQLTMFDISYPEPAQKALHSVMHVSRRAFRSLMRLRLR